VKVSYHWRGEFGNQELDALHAEGFAHPPADSDWWAQVQKNSLGWVCARDAGGKLVGFVNVPWDGGIHAFVVDTVVTLSARRQGIGVAMVQVVVEGARSAGCRWLHADYEDDLVPFYESCGFRSTPAGLIEL
jgi:GNAT superfamily N-acetyltransferase